MKNPLLDNYGINSKKELKLTDFIFKDCNNKCDFCFERDDEFKSVCHNIPKFKNFTKEYIVEHIDFIERFVSERSDKYESIKFTIMGGEIFAFDLEYIDFYFKLLVKNVFIKHRDKMSVQIVSNLMHDNLDYVLQILDSLKINNIKYILNTSFDFGKVRFYKKKKYKQFCDNINKLIELESEYNVGCGIILTSHMLESLTINDEQAKMFKLIYDNFYVDFARLSGNYDYKLTYDEAVKLWKIIIDRFPRLIQNNIYTENPAIRCCLNNHHVLFAGNEAIESCVSFVYAIHHNQNEKCNICKTSTIKKIAQDYNCFGCKYFGHCIPQCPLDDRYGKCDLKEAIDYLKQHEN